MAGRSKRTRKQKPKPPLIAQPLAPSTERDRQVEQALRQFRDEQGPANTYRAPFNPKYEYINKLGPGYKRCPPHDFVDSQPFNDSHMKARVKLFRLGYVGVNLGAEDCEVMVWPGQRMIALAWGYRKPDGGIIDCSPTVYSCSNDILGLLRARGHLQLVS